MFKDPVLQRQTVRNFTDEKVDKYDVERLIAAFQAAPCGMHQTDVMQAAVVEDDKMLARIEDATGQACYQAPLLFVISTRSDSAFGERDASCAAENILVEAAWLRLGGVYCMSGAQALNNVKELKKDLDIPHNFEVTVVVCVGHPTEHNKVERRSNRYKVNRF